MKDAKRRTAGMPPRLAGLFLKFLSTNEVREEKGRDCDLQEKGMEKRTFQDIEDFQETQEINRTAHGKAALIPESH